MVREIAPGAEEIVYAMDAPRSARMVWKHVRFAIGREEVVGIGTLPDHVDIWFYRGRELEDGTVKLKGSGKDTRFINLRTPADATGSRDGRDDAVRVDAPDAVVIGIGEVEVAGGIERDAVGIVQLRLCRGTSVAAESARACSRNDAE